MEESRGGVIARDHKGRFLGCITRELGIGTPMEGEAGAIYLGIELLQRLGLQQVTVEGDAKGLLDCINQTASQPHWRIASCVSDCRHILSTRSDVRFSYCPRVTNSVAHQLAAVASSYGVQCNWDGGEPPPHIRDSMYLDCPQPMDDG